MMMVVSFMQMHSVSAQIRVGWNDRVDLAKLYQVDKTEIKLMQRAWDDDIVWQKYDNDFKALYDLSLNKVDLVSVGMVPLLSVMTAGSQVRVIAVSSQDGTANALVARNQSNITSPKDLIGKKIAVPFLTNDQYSLLKALEHWKIGPNQVQIVNMKDSDILQAWKKGEIDAAYVHDQELLSLEKDGKVLVNSKQVADWGSPAYQFWVVVDTIIPTHLGPLQKFVDSNFNIILSYHKQKKTWTKDTQAVVEIAKFLNIPPADTLTLLKGDIYLGRKSQNQVINNLSSYLSNVALFLRDNHTLDNVAFDYLMYIDAEFINASTVK